MTPEEKLARARAELLNFESEHQRSKEDVLEAVSAWLKDARRLSAADVGPFIASGGSLHPEHLAAATRAYIVGSDGFEVWLTAQVELGGLLSRKQRDAQLERPERAIRDAEKGLEREKPVEM